MLHAPIRIGKNVVINEGVRMLTASHDINSLDWQTKSLPIQVGDYAWIATEAVVLAGRTIGEGAVVAARAIVTKDVAPYTVVAGNPAVVVGERAQLPFTYIPSRFSAAASVWFRSL